jgi:hypothetical protein
MRRMRRLLLLIPLLLLVGPLYGCGVGGGTMLVRHGGGNCGSFDGIISLAWTIHSAPATAMSCVAVDHLSIDVESGDCGATISPVPCALDKWIYANLPDGSVTATVTALDRNGATLASGYTVVNLTGTIPSSPAPLDLE